MSTGRQMETLLFLFLRRMRGPLLVVIAAYSISIGGLVLIPGLDDQGQRWYFDFFHAFYFVSFMGSTIGFGEIPYEFTPAQRAWVTVTLYLTVLSWLYAIGKIFTLLQEPSFVRAMTEARFIRAVRVIRRPFYIVCGYGETGSLLVRSMASRGIQPIVIDSNSDNISTLALEDLGQDVPSFCGDATNPRHLVEAGLKRPNCMGVVAITDSDTANVAIGVASKLIAPNVKVIARASNRDTVENLASFNTDHIINPFEVFGEHLAMALRSPTLHMLHIWLVSRPGQPLAPTLTPPSGNWIICGYGRFGRWLSEFLQEAGCKVRVIEANPDKAPENAVIGRGTEAGPLQEAKIMEADAVVAGTGSDINNLSVVMTARELNPDLYLVARLDRRRNVEIFKSAKLDLIMQSSRIITWRILPLLTTPLLSRFLRLMREQPEEKAQEVGKLLRRITAGQTPEVWSLNVNDREAPAIAERCAGGSPITVAQLIGLPELPFSAQSEGGKPRRRMRCMLLLLVRDNQNVLLPSMETVVHSGDRLLLCSRDGVERQMQDRLYNRVSLEHILTGYREPDGLIWRWWSRRHGSRAGG